MKKYAIKLFLGLFVCSIIVTMVVQQNANASIEKQVDNNIAAINEMIKKEVALKSELASSSNPYDYIKDNTDFEKIITLGNDALPVLHNKLAKSTNNGLQEYIPAIAIERIAKVDMKKKESTQWETAKDFEKVWKNHLKAIPATVEAIVSNKILTSEEKVKQLVELGTLAIPFIMDKVESDDEKVFPAVIELTKNNKSTVAPIDTAGAKDWVTKNKSSFNSLKQYVLNQQQQ
ncbi:hypothetical protein [Paenibacillus elgii]|uniref:hypothetical protein n=1 Tax=Paenibacillus elgii TaxID=189691 RepID=UPI00203C6E0A|nr:hypothetical protein [Paenibacillus elgii]MCM3268774.1 hypothetical protein [Paenibacillus elgii]